MSANKQAKRLYNGNERRQINKCCKLKGGVKSKRFKTKGGKEWLGTF